MPSPMSSLTRRQFVACTSAMAGVALTPARAAELAKVQPQPYFASVNRITEAMARLGSPLSLQDSARLKGLASARDDAAVREAERMLNRYTLASVAIDSQGASHASMGGAQKILVEQGWRIFLVRVSNPDGITKPFNILPQGPAMPPGHMDRWIAPDGFSMAQHPPVVDTVNNAGWLTQSWCIARLSDTDALTGLPIEYRILEIFSRDHGNRSATPSFGVGKVIRRGQKLDFECLPSRDVDLAIKDMDGRGCVASLIIKDSSGRVYPPQLMRIAPDLPFQLQVYRGDGETVRLPDGEYTIECKRGPEYVRNIQTANIANGNKQINIALKRWIDPSKWGWYSGDTHIHAAGCAHYDVPTQGVSPETMIRHVRGEGLSIAEVLTWGPGYDYQKKFFTGRAISPHATLEYPDLQKANNVSLQTRDTAKDPESLIRYDLEISRFPSSHAGHLVLLRVASQEYPGAEAIEDWPSWNVPILKWAKAQGAITGYAHCGGGMDVDSLELPNYEIPLFDGLGTNEAIVDVTHELVDFLSGCDLAPVAELNAWYHMLNSGFRLAMVGETDFPCISDERPGTGRSYVRLEHRPVDNFGYELWANNLKKGKLYCGDGRSHFLEFEVNGRASGDGDVMLGSAGGVQIKGLVAARLEPVPTAETQALRTENQSWHLEHARIGNTRTVAVELIVNGQSVDRTEFLADGLPRPVQFTANISRSSWVALRIMPSAHTYPVFVQVNGAPIRASARSAKWCRNCVDKLWEVKSPFMRPSELAAAREGFDHARFVYDQITKECEIA